MAAKQTVAGMKPAEAITGTIQGKRFKVVLDDIKIGDKWDATVLSILHTDGIGKVSIIEGVTYFTFNTSSKATIAFKAEAGNLVVDAFYVEDDGKEQA